MTKYYKTPYVFKITKFVDMTVLPTEEVFLYDEFQEEENDPRRNMKRKANRNLGCIDVGYFSW